MLKHWSLPLYITLLCLDLTCVALDFVPGHAVFKFLLMPALSIYWFSQTSTLSRAIRVLGGLSLFCAWLGDVALMTPGKLGMLLGIPPFLLAHVCYIFLFLQIRKRIKPTPPLNMMAIAIVALIVVAALYFLLQNQTDAFFLIAIPVYACTLGSMMIVAVHSFHASKPGRWVIIGAGVFLVSDTLIGLGAFVTHFPGHSFLVMLTYGVAQLLLIGGCLRYLYDNKPGILAPAA